MGQAEAIKKMNLSQLKTLQKKLILKVYSQADWSFLPSFIWFSYLGARICYAETHPLAIFQEEKFRDHLKLVKFLVHLKTQKHFSVFAHTPVPVSLSNFSEREKYEIAKSFYKVFWDEEDRWALFNLRHFAENLEENIFENLISIKPNLEEMKIKIFKNWVKIYEGNFSGLFLEKLGKEGLNKEESPWATPEVIIIESKKDFPLRWIGVIVHNLSRVFSHQFVRHTWLNFNQRSHRYTKVEKFIVPSGFSEDCFKRYKEIILNSLKIYQELCVEVKKESARLVIPQGVTTTLLATGPLLVWEDFVSKRALPQVQEEIKNLAFLLKENLFEEK
ncbi:MAG: FAD-dependent thymidylate synthase [Thermodesulfobacteriaceae bacterium]|nr:FAD-dependent thymidylate synthase [Thermodesulfobacteriaceae bacterium]MDW8135680.1 FAD-dependent thymidylate synthase [Thermodesulfobacterium sp.]